MASNWGTICCTSAASCCADGVGAGAGDGDAGGDAAGAARTGGTTGDATTGDAATELVGLLLLVLLVLVLFFIDMGSPVFWARRGPSCPAVAPGGLSRPLMETFRFGAKTIRAIVFAPRFCRAM